MSPYSLNISLRSSVRREYRPSSGETAWVFIRLATHMNHILRRSLCAHSRASYHTVNEDRGGTDSGSAGSPVCKSSGTTVSRRSIALQSQLLRSDAGLCLCRIRSLLVPCAPAAAHGTLALAPAIAVAAFKQCIPLITSACGLPRVESLHCRTPCVSAFFFQKKKLRPAPYELLHTASDLALRPITPSATPSLPIYILTAFLPSFDCACTGSLR